VERSYTSLSMRCCSSRGVTERRASNSGGITLRRLQRTEGRAPVHRFNQSGFTTFEKQPNHRGRPIMIDGERVREVHPRPITPRHHDHLVSGGRPAATRILDGWSISWPRFARSAKNAG
jgi:hypothetical protein